MECAKKKILHPLSRFEDPRFWLVDVIPPSKFPSGDKDWFLFVTAPDLEPPAMGGVRWVWDVAVHLYSRMKTRCVFMSDIRKFLDGQGPFLLDAMLPGEPSTATLDTGNRMRLYIRLDQDTAIIADRIAQTFLTLRRPDATVVYVTDEIKSNVRQECIARIEQLWPEALRREVARGAYVPSEATRNWLFDSYELEAVVDNTRVDADEALPTRARVEQ